MSQTLKDLWLNNRVTLEGKTLEQLLTFAGDGILRNSNSTSIELREFLNEVPLIKLESYINECLSSSFINAPFALQDMVNELGLRLGYRVEHGLYRGNRNQIGFDGFWQSIDNDIIIEVKTTDAYVIKLDTIANYRNSLIDEHRTGLNRSSVLIVVGRNDTGELEAQIRGSRHAWDMRLISVESLIKLIRIKEELLDNENTFRSISRVLQPMEFTRLDYLVDTLFITGKEVQDAESAESNLLINTESLQNNINNENNRSTPVNFHIECVRKINEYLSVDLTRKTKTFYRDVERNIGLTCAISRNYSTDENALYWFAFKRHQKESLAEVENAYISFGCGDETTIFLFNYSDFIEYLGKMPITESGNNMYWHVKIERVNSRYFLHQGHSENIDITDKLISFL